MCFVCNSNMVTLREHLKIVIERTLQKRGGDIEVFDLLYIVRATAEIRNNKEERIKNNNGVRKADES